MKKLKKEKPWGYQEKGKFEILYLTDSSDWIANPLTSQVEYASRLPPKAKVGLIKLSADSRI